MKSSAKAVLLLGVGLAWGQHHEPTLAEAFRADFRMGAALNPSQFENPGGTGSSIVTRHFNSITPENVMKWEQVHPVMDRYEFGSADRFVEFGTRHRMFIVGHTLVWHSQTPDWVFTDSRGARVDRNTLLERMEQHITTVVGRYKGRIHAWDVVNEALNEDGSLRKSPWLEIIGEDYIVRAFEFARRADPAAELYYNDYGLKTPAKRQGALRIIKQLRAAGARIDAVGMQTHANLHWPPDVMIEQAILDFAKHDIDVMITELDVDVLPARNGDHSADVSRNEAPDPSLDPYASGLPPNLQRLLADRYAGIFGVLLKHSEHVRRVTFWGVTDRDSWLNHWPIAGRTNHPLLFDRNGKPKPAFEAVLTLPASSAVPRSP